MFDIATRPQPSTTDAAAVFGVPFDWRLAPPTAVAQAAYVDHRTGVAVAGVEALATYALALEDTLQTAIILSLFSDRRAGRDDALPLGQTDRRGWVGDEYMGDDFQGRTDAWGSGLWLCYVSKATAGVLERARFEAQEALAWLVRDEIASRVAVTAAWAGERQDRLAVRPQVYKPGQVQPVYDVLWGTSIRRAAQ
ncbi:MAG: phage GP46 family protein [Comamonas sp.]